jgi:hypothetical protein
MKKVVSE